MNKSNLFRDISSEDGNLSEFDIRRLVPLPPPYDDPGELRPAKKLNDETIKNYDNRLDGIITAPIARPADSAAEAALVDKFIAGLRKLFSANDNWEFLEPLVLTVEHCARCQTCADACPVFIESGRNEIYRPSYRSEILRRLYYKYVKPGNRLTRKFHNNDIILNWRLIARLYELAYRCTLCRRCAQTCPMAADNGLVSRELRKLFSQQLGFAPRELHEKGTLQQLSVGSSTGMTPAVVRDNIEFIDEDMSERSGIKVETKWDQSGADVLLLHNAGEILAWPDNPGAFALLLDAAGIKWTLSSEIAGYDGVNYGLFYDDVQLARVAKKHLDIARKLGVKRIVMGECGHESKALGVVSDRIITGGVPRISAMTLIEEIVFSGRIDFDRRRNNFPVTLHDPCNLVRSMGISEPQRRVLRRLAPGFREMSPHGVHNYCCGGGSGFAIMDAFNFGDWKMALSGRRKLRQVLDAFAGEPASQPKYLCAPCSNCKGMLRDILDYYGARQKSNIYYGGLVELVVNAMTSVREGFIDFEMM